MPAADNILFLTLRTFSLTGGIEKVCRVATRILYDLSEKGSIRPMVYSMYDRTTDRDAKYILKTQFQGFNGQRVRFSLEAAARGIRSDKVILSHINLLFIALLIKRFSPTTRIILFAHGIEVWRKISSWKRNFLRKYCDEIWAVSQYTANKMQELHGVPASRIRVVNNCLDPFLEIPASFEKPAALLTRYQLHAGQPVLFTLTRLSSSELYKGYDLVIASVAELREQFPGLKYLIAGKADAEEAQRLQQLIREHGLDGHVILLGFVPEEELTEHFLLADVFVMPSRKEGFGIVFIEAAACGCQTIGGNQDGSVDALLQGQLGTLVSPENKEELSAAIREALCQPRTAEKAMGIQQLCLEHFNYESYSKKVEGLLSRSLTSKRR